MCVLVLKTVSTRPEVDEATRELRAVASEFGYMITRCVTANHGELNIVCLKQWLFFLKKATCVGCRTEMFRV